MDPGKEKILFEKSVVLLGVFDGWHLGHQQLFMLAKEVAGTRPLVIVTFSPQPKVFFNPNAKLLSSDQQRLANLTKLPVSAVMNLQFNQQLADLTAEQFVTDFLVKQLQMKDLVVGANFRCGRQRSGDLACLQQLGKQLGFKTKVSSLLALNGETCSSTSIRSLISDGQVAEAANLLGRHWQITGPVIRGRGANHHVPTINLKLGQLVAPKPGVYAGYVTKTGGQELFPAAIYLGRGAAAGTIEAHLLGQQLELYGQHVTLSLRQLVRDDASFATSNLLDQQIKADLSRVAALTKHFPLDLTYRSS